MRNKLAYGVLSVALGLIPIEGQAKDIQPSELPEAVLALYHSDKNCFDLKKAKLPEAIITDDLGDNQKLYIIPCSSGAYNVFSKVFITREGETEEMFFADYHSVYGWSGTNVLVNIGYDPKTRRLTSFNKSVGHGWCGSAGIWRWKEYDFQMRSFSAWDDCEKDKAPEDWPVVYQKK